MLSQQHRAVNKARALRHPESPIALGLSSYKTDFVLSVFDARRSLLVYVLSSRMLETSETKIETLRALLAEGEKSGFADYSYEKLIQELDENH